jgi:ribonuclease P protein component
VETEPQNASSILLAVPPDTLFLILLSDLEAHLSAQRASAKAPARLPSADGHARRSGDPQAPSRAGPQAPVGLTTPGRVERRHRLSRSRDFEAVYRHGRSFASRYVVLYWFPREDSEGDPRLGLAVPKSLGSAVTRNRLKRQLREAWRARLERVPPGRDYVLVARTGLSEAAESRGLDWLGERIDEVLRRVT